MCVYFTFLHLVSYLTINQQFGREATKTHSDQRQVMSENGLFFEGVDNESAEGVSNAKT